MNKIQSYDKQISSYFPHLYATHPHINRHMKFIAGIGDFGMIWLGCVLLALTHVKTRLLGQEMLAALLVATIIGQVTIKSLVRRDRPCHRYPIDNMLVAIPNDFSFPSGHTTSSFACATVIICMFPLIGIVFFLFSIMMAFSRLYLYVHYLSDVVCGALLGIIIGYIIYII